MKHRIHLLRETWRHMSAVSGFDPLFASLQEQGGAKVVSHHVPAALPRPALHQRIISQFGLRFSSPPPIEISPLVEAHHITIAKKCLTILTQNSDDILVLSAGENQLASCLATASPDIRKRIFIFFHQPPAWFRLHWRNQKFLCGLGGIFALSAQQANFLREYSGSSVHEIRHGVCLDFFKPSNSPLSGQPRFLFVGQWLRDFDTLSKTIPLILNEHPDARFDLVIPHSARQREQLYPLAMRPEVSWHAGISPEALLTLYQKATALLLPLTDSTANNGILEAMACGLPVITTAVGGCINYLPETAGIFCQPGDAQSHARAALSLLRNPNLRQSMGQAGRIHAEAHFAWHHIAREVKTLISPT